MESCAWTLRKPMDTPRTSASVEMMDSLVMTFPPMADSGLEILHGLADTLRVAGLCGRESHRHLFRDERR
jgi:hypothetical protein